MIPIYVEIYICVLLAFIGLWILIDAMLDTWEAEHQILISQLEEQEKHSLQTKRQDFGRTLSRNVKKAEKWFMI